MKIRHLEEGFVAGMILGDGHLSKRQRCLELCHTKPQQSYMLFKLSLAEQFGYNVRRYRNAKKRTNIGTYEYCKGYVNMHNIGSFYQYGLSRLANALNPLGLLIWWLDDGCLSIHTKKNNSVSRFGYLNTQSFTYSENELLSEILFDKFGIETTIHVDSKSGLAKSDHYRLYINATNFRRFIDLVREFIPWIPRTMYYKLNMQYVVNRNRDSFNLVTHYNF